MPACAGMTADVYRQPGVALSRANHANAVFSFPVIPGVTRDPACLFAAAAEETGSRVKPGMTKTGYRPRG